MAIGNVPINKTDSHRTNVFVSFYFFHQLSNYCLPLSTGLFVGVFAWLVFLARLSSYLRSFGNYVRLAFKLSNRLLNGAIGLRQ